MTRQHHLYNEYADCPLSAMHLFACRTEDELPKGAVVISRAAVIEGAPEPVTDGDRLILYRVDEEILQLEQEIEETVDACERLAALLG